MTHALNQTSQTLDSPHSIEHTTDSRRSPIYLPQGSPSARWIDSVADLEALLNPWNQLAEQAIWRNSAFEPNFLIPAYRQFAKSNVRILVVEDLESHSDSPILLGLVPLVKKKFYRLPVAALEIWKHDQCSDTTPLIHTQSAVSTLKAIFDFLANEKNSLLSFDTVSAESGFENVLQAALEETGISDRFQRDTIERAALCPGTDVDEYFKSFVSKNVKKNCKRLKRRLEDLGDVVYEQSDEFSDYQQLTQQFLEIEASGWKVEAGTALLCQPESKQFYEELIARSAQAGKARFLSLKLDGKPIAMLSDLQSGSTVFSYKTAFDEHFSQFSPGLQIELENIRRLHASDVKLADSCTAPDNATINRIWGQKLKFQSLVIGLRPGSRWITKLLPWMQTASKWFKRQTN